MAFLLKKEAHELIEALPDSATWDDLAEMAHQRAALERGLDAADSGDFADPDRITAMFARWGVETDD